MTDHTQPVVDVHKDDGVVAPDKPHVGLHPAHCPVVGLGASAGGLEAFQKFLMAAQVDAGIAYVLVQHLDPNHESMLAELLGRRTPMPVRQVTDGMPIEANNVYLIPPNASLVIEKAHLKLADFSEPRGFRRPIDMFFRSLAIDQGPNAACIVLSGTGGDGSEGLRAVKEAGGLTMVQAPETAKYDGMPKSAVATGLVDQVLPVDAMPQAVRDYFDRGQVEPLKLQDVTDFLLQVSEELRYRIGHDFSQYKRNTVLRRVQRRMQVIGVASGAEYLDYLREKKEEAELLLRDLLINVTSFFRDPEVFDILRLRVIPELIADRGASDTIRIWTPGCSSGEEAYSIAILMSEALARRRVRPTVQIFATDIDEPMLHKARAGCYPHTVVRDIPPELLDRYFLAHEDEYVVSQAIRDMVRVSGHNLIKDPPFSRIDLICCRNLLIYLNATLQQRLMPVFHYALKPQGVLVLGSAENMAGRTDLFETVDQAARIYRRKGGRSNVTAVPFALTNTPANIGGTDRQDRPRSGTGNERAEAAVRRIVERYGPAHVIVDSDHQIVHASARTGRYLELAPGAPSSKVADLARRGLRSAVRAVLETAHNTKKTAIKRDVKIEDGDSVHTIDLIADPVGDAEVLLVFQDVASSRLEPTSDAQARVEDYTDEDRISELEDELDETRVKLRTTVEELETSNEELKSSNEEMMSMNEELQSTNEELSTVNEELKNKVDQLARANSDLQNYLESTRIATIFLDRKLRIRSFTPETRKLFRFQEQDRGRPFSDVAARLDAKQLEQDAQQVLETGQPIEKEIILEDTHEYHALRVLPYRDLEEKIDGIILTFTDVTKIRETQADLVRNERIARERLIEIEALYKTAPVGMALVDRNRRFVKINQHFAAVSGDAIESHIGRTIHEVFPDLAERMEPPIADVLRDAAEVANVETRVRVNGGPFRDFLIDFYPYEQDGGLAAVGIILKDVTELRRLEVELRRLMHELQHRVKNTLATVASIVHQTVKSKTDPAELAEALRSRVGALAATHSMLTSRDWRDVSLEEIIQAELKPFWDDERLVLKGPTVALPPKHGLTLTLTLHELATNAAKYGALSVPSGRLSIEWNVHVDADARHLNIHWTESDGPAVRAHARESFGSRLIKQAVEHDLGGSTTLELPPEGARCIISVPF